MLAKEKKDIESVVEILKKLDKESLLIIDAGARMLKARQDMEKKMTQHMSK
jgi:hypothetical protein